jgi:PKD repeat protein
MKTRAVLVIMMMLASGLLALSTAIAGDSTPRPLDNGTTNEPMQLFLNSRRADLGPTYLDFRIVERGEPSKIASIQAGADYGRVFGYPYMAGQKVSSKYDPSLEAVIDVYVNSGNVPGKTVRFKVEVDRNGDGRNDTVIDFPAYTTVHNASPEHVVARGTVYFNDPEVSKDMSAARVFLKIWRTDTLDDKFNRLIVYCGFMSDTESPIESIVKLPWVNPVPHVEVNSPLDYNTTGKTYFNNEPILFDGRGSRDPTGETLGYVWSFDRLEYPPVYDKDNYTRSFKDPGWYTVKLNVSNSLYFTNETSVTFRVLYKNHAPIMVIKTRAATTGLFEAVPDQITTYTFIPQEWLAAVTDPDGDNVTVSWDFGDGVKSTAYQLNHTFTTPGTYTVTCNAFDGNETSGHVSKTIIVRVEPNHVPIAMIEISGIPWTDVTPAPTTPGYRGREVRIDLGDNVRFTGLKSYDPDGMPMQSFKWDFNDVYATEDNPRTMGGIESAHRFLVEGEYNVTLTVFDGVKYGYSHVWIRTNNAPIAVPPQTIRTETDAQVTFSAVRSSDPDPEDMLRFKWDFGDNTRTDWMETPVATHTYRITATYTVTLYVSDALLQSTGTTKVYVDPRNHPPKAVMNITDDINDLWTNMTIHFTSVGSYDIDGEGRITFAWDFNDGTDPSTFANPTHVYTRPGTYTVTLTVIDAKEVTDIDSLTIPVMRNYGDTDIVIKALDHASTKTFRDPDPKVGGQPSVMRDGWVAYVVDLRKGDKVEVKITVIGDHPADIYLLSEVNFQTYRRNPQVTFVPFEANGYKKGMSQVTDPKGFTYTFTPRTGDRYYIVVDNKNWPIGTITQGPVDYTFEVTPKWDIKKPGPLPGASSVAALAALGAVAVAAVAVRRRLE